MKRMPLLSAALIIMMAATVTSCKPSRVWATKDKDDKKEKRYDRDGRDDGYEREERYDRYAPVPPPPPPRYNAVRLVITPTPGFVMNQYPDGRYYHRNANGFLYWKGYDNRFFLDRSYLARVSYSQRQYDEWRRYNNRR